MQPDFAEAVFSIINGDVANLVRIIDRDLRLTHARGDAPFHATLLHYTAANGVEDVYQKSPINAGDVARILLERGALPDATSAAYGGECTSLDLVCSSFPPYRAGVQVDLVRALLDFGAAIDGLRDDGSPLGTALLFGYTAAAEALAVRGARVDNIVFAAGLGDVERVMSFLSDDGSVHAGGARYRRRDDDLEGRYSWPPPRAGDARDQAFVVAAMHGRIDVLELLHANGVPVNATLAANQTALHYAASLGRREVITWLLARGADASIIEAQFNKTAAQWADEAGESEIASLLRSRIPHQSH